MRINAYCSPAPDGGVSVDVEGMSVDLVTALKAAGWTKDMMEAYMHKQWDEVKVEVTIPDKYKN